MWTPKEAHVWAAQVDTPSAGNVCRDARLRGAADLRHDEVFGQAGWNIGLSFHSLAHLAMQLRTVSIPGHIGSVTPGKVRRLAVNAHGAPGRVYVDGNHRDDTALGLATLSQHASALDTIREMTAARGVVYFMGCNVAAGGDGPELLRRLSEALLRERFVVGFEHRGYIPPGGVGMNRERITSGTMCIEPGMRDGDGVGSSGEARGGGHPGWRNLRALPWATAHSRSAVVAFEGHIVGSPQMPAQSVPPWY
ncbi:MAG: DUF4347 domain-containing protein [Sandaracinaceae bacterium]|nr:DUF4347 domain-containing protein [Sandaracinaceae bacterium]